MKTHRNFFVGNGIKKPKQYIKKLNNGKFIPGLYIVSLNENNKLEIYVSYIFMQKIYRELNLTFVAFFNDFGSALEYIRKITALSYKKYNDFLPAKCIDNLDCYDVDYLYSESEEEMP